MSNHNDNNFSPYMDDFREMIIFKKFFLSEDKEKFISNILADYLKSDEEFIFKNIEVYDRENEIMDLNYYKKPNRIVCYVGNMNFLIRMHINTKEKLFHELLTYHDYSNDVTENDMYTCLISVKR